MLCFHSTTILRKNNHRFEIRAPIFPVTTKLKNIEREKEREKNHLHKIWWLRIFESNWCVSISTFDNHFCAILVFALLVFVFRSVCYVFFFWLDETKFSLRLICLRFSVTRTKIMVVLAILEWATLQFFFLMSLNECWFSHCWFLFLFDIIFKFTAWRALITAFKPKLIASIQGKWTSNLCFFISVSFDFVILFSRAATHTFAVSLKKKISLLKANGSIDYIHWSEPKTTNKARSVL